MGNQVSTEEEWFSTIVTQLSPRFGEFASGLLSQQVEPLLQNVMRKSHLPDVHFRFERTDFGTIPPKISNLKTHRTPDGQEAKSIIIDFDFSYLGDCDLQVSLLGMRSGVRDVQMSGRCRFVMKPTTKTFPLVGGIQMCFLDIPDIHFDMDGLANVCDWPLLRRKFRKEMREDIAKKCVYPNRVIIPLSGSLDAMHIKSFEPTGLVGVKVVNATDLPRKKGLRSLVGQDKPDPYVKARIGSQIKETSVVKNKVNPVWPEGEPWLLYLLETAKGHRLRLDVYDEDSMSHDDFFGKVVVDIGKFFGQEEPATMTLPLEDDPEENSERKPIAVSGSLTFQVRWQPLLNAWDTDIASISAVVVTIFVYSCNNLKETQNGHQFGAAGDAPTSMLEVQAGQIIKKSEEKKNNLHPSFEEDFTFLFGPEDNWQEMEASITLIETERGGYFGSYKLPLVSLLGDRPLKRQLVSFVPDKPHITMTLSANIKMAV